MVSILSERRAFQPYGLLGGEPGCRGENLLLTALGKTINLGGKNTIDVVSGDVLVIKSPGGGGYGEERCEVLSVTNSIETTGRQTPNVHVLTSGSLQQYSLDQESA